MRARSRRSATLADRSVDQALLQTERGVVRRRGRVRPAGQRAQGFAEPVLGVGERAAVLRLERVVVDEALELADGMPVMSLRSRRVLQEPLDVPKPPVPLSTGP